MKLGIVQHMTLCLQHWLPVMPPMLVMRTWMISLSLWPLLFTTHNVLCWGSDVAAQPNNVPLSFAFSFTAHGGLCSGHGINEHMMGSARAKE